MDDGGSSSTETIRGGSDRITIGNVGMGATATGSIYVEGVR
jgi:hypothetical protein